MDVKIGVMDLDEARRVGQRAIDHVIEISDKFCENLENVADPEMEALLKEVQVSIMKKAIIKELQ